jgi:hypothetical protein
MKDIHIRKIQQSAKDHSLQLNLPKSFTRLENLRRGNMLQCKIMNLKNNHSVLVVEKLFSSEVTT